MKLKRPSGINEYDTLADIDGEGGVSPTDSQLTVRQLDFRPLQHANQATVTTRDTAISLATRAQHLWRS
jgi:hypothetical protein